jgi:hypothetical protein
MTHHLAQLSIAQMQGALDDPVMADFVAQIDEMNAAAEASPEFIWRLVMDDNEAGSLSVFNRQHLLLNLSVWTSVEALRDYAYRGVHADPLRDRQRWFLPMDQPTSVLWWVPSGHHPDGTEGKTRLEYLALNGPSVEAFTFGQRFLPPEPQRDATGLKGQQ